MKRENCGPGRMEALLLRGERGLKLAVLERGLTLADEALLLRGERGLKLISAALGV